MSAPPISANTTEEPYQPPIRKPWFVNAYLALMVLVNLVLLWQAWEDRSWGAFKVAFVDIPIANGVLFLASLLILAFRYAIGWRTSALGGVTMVFLPFFAVVIDLLIISNMGLSGC